MWYLERERQRALERWITVKTYMATAMKSDSHVLLVYKFVRSANASYISKRLVSSDKGIRLNAIKCSDSTCSLCPLSCENIPADTTNLQAIL